MLNTVLIQLYQVQAKESIYLKQIDGLMKLLQDFDQHQIAYRFIDDIEKELNEVCAKDCLVISDQEKMIDACVKKGIPCVAYENNNLSKQDLFQAAMLVEGFQEVDYTFVLQVYQRFHHIPIVIGETNRIVIREMELSDLDALYELYDDETIQRFVEPLYEREEETEFTKAYIKNMYGFYGYGLWLLFDKKTGYLVGRAGLSNRVIDNEIQVELGYLIGSPYQRQGIAFEVCRKILLFAVTHLECHAVNCFIDPANIASHRLVEKLEFKLLQEILIDDKIMLWYRWTYEVGTDIMNI